jgi:hypothetical protein
MYLGGVDDSHLLGQIVCQIGQNLQEFLMSLQRLFQLRDFEHSHRFSIFVADSFHESIDSRELDTVSGSASSTEIPSAQTVVAPEARCELMSLDEGLLQLSYLGAGLFHSITRLAVVQI